MSEEYDGTSWTEGNDLNTARRLLAGAGTQTAGLAYGGHPPNLNNSEEYDGTSWTEGNNLNTGRRGLVGAGIQTAALAMGGTPSKVEEYK